jgi:telomerase reverse transcriptase
MLFDTRTGEVFVDYKRFIGGQIRDSLTVHRTGTEGKMLGFRMQNFVRPRCLPILFDSSINSKNTIVTNYYQMMLLAAVKTAEYLRESGLSSTSNAKFLVGRIDAMSLYASKQIRSNLKKYCPDANRNKLILDRATTSWLCWRAFQDVFRHLSGFNDLNERIHEEVCSWTRNYNHILRKTLLRAFVQFRLHQMMDC